ncbi:MAG: hypothetical protein V4631_18270 [Pseudomonadota bacterium]
MNLMQSALLRALLACSALAMAGAVHAQAAGDQNVPAATAQKQAAEISRGDPPRWHQEDSTPAARLRTIRKEIAAGLQENLGACRALPAAERSACVREARATYQLEMAGARARAASGS